MTCDCDRTHCAPPFKIPAGLALLPRAPGLFPDWRRWLLAAVGREPQLDNWRAREPGDLGVMLVEMAAYVFDVTSFYDSRVANDSFLATAVLAGRQRQLVALLGYLPRPAVGTAVWLAAEADGPRVVALPAGTAFRSGEFDGNPPQVFELDSAAAIDPRINKLDVDRVRATLLPSPLASVMARSVSVRVEPGTRLLFDFGSALAAARVASVATAVLRVRDVVSRITLAATVAPSAGATHAGTRVFKPGANAAAWKLAPVGTELPVLTTTELSLERRLDLRVGDAVLIQDGNTLVARRLSAVGETTYTIIGPQTSTITDADDNVSTLVSPAIKVGVTRVTFNAALPAGLTVAGVVLHHTMVEALRLYSPLKDTLEQGDPIGLPGLADPPRVEVESLMLEDPHGEGVVTTGVLDAATRSALGDTAPAWGLALWAPVKLYGNALLATRGESVKGELLGSGDGAQALQTFRLKKKPLTYLAAANAAGRASTLVIRVGGVRWREVDTFYGVADTDTVYTVRHDEDGNTDVQFGGGARLATGASVVADYRFGAGAAAPPADSVKQVARPVAGLRKVHNVLPAFGGADAEGASELAVRGPRSALLLGRAISLVDFETAAAEQAGVRAARAAWRWDALGLRPAVVVTIIGDAQVEPAVLATLRALAEPDAPISVQVATSQPARLDVDVAIDPDRVPADVIAAIQQALFAAGGLPGSGGLLRAERLGPDGVLFQSHVVRAVMEVDGVVELRSLGFDDTPFAEVARAPATGSYFDFDAAGGAGGVWVNGARAL